MLSSESTEPLGTPGLGQGQERAEEAAASRSSNSRGRRRGAALSPRAALLCAGWGRHGELVRMEGPLPGVPGEGLQPQLAARLAHARGCAQISAAEGCCSLRRELMLNGAGLVFRRLRRRTTDPSLPQRQQSAPPVSLGRPGRPLRGPVHPARSPVMPQRGQWASVLRGCQQHPGSTQPPSVMLSETSRPPGLYPKKTDGCGNMFSLSRESTVPHPAAVLREPTASRLHL